MLFARTKLTCVWIAFCCLSAPSFIQSGLCTDTKRIACQDGSYATVERSTTYMGKEVRSWMCPMNSTGQNVAVSVDIHGRKDFDLCPATYTIYCNEPILDGGPDPEDCNSLASYYAGDGRFTIEPKKYIVWEYNTCRVTQYNRRANGQKISYCFDDHHWAGVVKSMSSHCGARSGSNGGSCFFYDSVHISTIVLERA